MSRTASRRHEKKADHQQALLQASAYTNKRVYKQALLKESESSLYSLLWAPNPVYMPDHPRTLTIAWMLALVDSGTGSRTPISWAIITSSCLRTLTSSNGHDPAVMSAPDVHPARNEAAPMSRSEPEARMLFWSRADLVPV